MVDVTCWYQLESSFYEEFKYEIVILILYHLGESAIYADSDWKVHVGPYTGQDRPLSQENHARNGGSKWSKMADYI